MTICDGDCRSYRAMSARCGASGVELEGRTWYRCTISYSGGLRAEHVCAALVPPNEYKARPLRDCKR